MDYPDIFYTPEYARLFEDTKFGGQIESRYIRKIPDTTTLCDAVMPYGYTTINEPVCEFARLHPFLEHNCSKNHLRQIGEVVYIDLLESIEDIWNGYSKGCKSSVKKVERSGVSVTATEWLQDIDDTHKLYIKTMQRNDAHESYMFPFDFFYTAMHLLKGHIKLFVAEYQGKIIAGALFLHYGDFVHYFLGGSDIDYITLCPNNLILDTAIRWAKDEGYKIFNLGGGLGGSHDKLMSFKRSFSHKTKPMFIYCRVNNPELYKALCLERGVDPDDMNYFPVYRSK